MTSAMEDAGARLVEADPLEVARASVLGSWWNELRLGLIPRPAWAVGAVAVTLAFVAGVVLGPALVGPPRGIPGTGAYNIAKPRFVPSPETPAFGIAPSVSPEADRQFREAMAFYDAPDFAGKVIPRLQEAVTLDPRHDQAQFWLGIAYLLRGDVGAAIPALEAAVTLAPAKIQYKQYLVWAYLASSRNEDALRLQGELLNRR